MPVRTAALRDLTWIRALPIQLGAVSTHTLTGRRLAELVESPDQLALVHTTPIKRSAFLALQFLPGREFKGHFSIITFFAVDRPGRDWDTAREIEDHSHEIARTHFSYCMLSQCKLKSPEARRFFLCQGYKPLDHHFIKYFTC